MSASDSPGDLIKAARAMLEDRWSIVTDSDASYTSDFDIPDTVLGAIRDSINSKTKTYRYVLPTQILAKAVAPQLNCLSIQAQAELEGAFDARSLCHKVIVPFDREHSSALGGSKEPYLNNPLRIPSITAKFRVQQKDKTGYDLLRDVLEYAEANPEHAVYLLDYTLVEIYRREHATSLVYPVPNRISFDSARSSIAQFLGARTGGVRLQAVSHSLFSVIGKRFGIFTQVSSHNVNASDTSLDSTADLECKDKDGSIVLSVEVKDQELTLRHVQDKLPGIRSKGITELLFLVSGHIASSDEEQIDDLIGKQFSTGQNVYVVEFFPFLNAILVLLGESGRRKLLKEVGSSLDDQRADYTHRKAWSEMLERL